jgi:hypothetical protein
MCDGFVPDEVVECPGCSFPQNGDETSQCRFLGELRLEKRYEALAAFRVGDAFQFLLGLAIGFFVVAYSFWQHDKTKQPRLWGCKQMGWEPEICDNLFLTYC